MSLDFAFDRVRVSAVLWADDFCGLILKREFTHLKPPERGEECSRGQRRVD